MSDCLERTWEAITASYGIDDNFRDEWWIKILQNYSDEKRKYHNLNFLENKFKHLDEVKNNIKNINVMSFAIFFQYLEYDPSQGMKCQDKNLEQFWKFINEARISNQDDTGIYSEVTYLLNIESTDEHKSPGVYGSDDIHYFLDLDMLELGTQPEEYLSYTQKLREEYDFLKDQFYFSLRIKLLQNFLQIPNIYATKEFRDRYESIARENIEQEIKRLE
uniref:Uncharacterized protein n=1 Tax=Cacopsylla melanoneura TaxID=428564 RepID=A0A8D8Y9K6_9HEMI